MKAGGRKLPNLRPLLPHWDQPHISIGNIFPLHGIHPANQRAARDVSARWGRRWASLGGFPRLEGEEKEKKGKCKWEKGGTRGILEARVGKSPLHVAATPPSIMIYTQ